MNNAQVSLPVPILNDLSVEPNETFTLQILEPSCGAKLGVTTVHTLTILDDEATVSLSSGAASVSEGAGSAGVTVQVVPANGQPLSNTVTVQYATADGTALAGLDYTARSDTLTFTPASPGPQVVTVPVINDTLDEPEQTFTLSLSGVTGGTLGSPWTQTVTILDDDPPPVVSLTNPVVTEGHTGVTGVVFTASLDRGSEWNPSVSFVTADGTALIYYSRKSAQRAQTSMTARSPRARREAPAPQPTGS